MISYLKFLINECSFSCYCFPLFLCFNSLLADPRNVVLHKRIRYLYKRIEPQNYEPRHTKNVLLDLIHVSMMFFNLKLCYRAILYFPKAIKTTRKSLIPHYNTEAHITKKLIIDKYWGIISCDILICLFVWILKLWLFARSLPQL